MTKQLIGTGRLSWNRHERVSDRYGAVTLHGSSLGQEVVINQVPCVAGRLVAEVIETRQSHHIGDLFRGLAPSTPQVGERIELGQGTLFFEASDGLTAVGLSPEDDRASDWLDPQALYRVHSQTVRLWFVPRVRPAAAKKTSRTQRKT